MNESSSNPQSTEVTNEQLREGGAMPLIVKAMEHDTTDVPPVDPAATYKAIETGVVGTYQKIEDEVVGTYKKLEDAVVGAYKKVEGHFIGKFLTRDGETVEDARQRLQKNGEQQ